MVGDVDIFWVVMAGWWWLVMLAGGGILGCWWLVVNFLDACGWWVVDLFWVVVSGSGLLGWWYVVVRDGSYKEIQKYFSSSCPTNFFRLVLKIFFDRYSFSLICPTRKHLQNWFSRNCSADKKFAKFGTRENIYYWGIAKHGNKEKTQILHLLLIAFGKDIFFDY